MKLEFTEGQSREMFGILVEIHDALKDKRTNKGFKLSVVERGWFFGIDEFLNRIDVPVIKKNKIDLLNDNLM